MHEDRTYTFVALTATTTLPRLYAAVPAGRVPHRPGNYFRRAGHMFGLHRFTLAVPICDGLTGHTYWDLGVKVGSTINLIRFHPVKSRE